jgi:hypothetical protein
MANIYRVYNGVSNDVYKYDFSFVPNCNSYNIFSCVWNINRCTWKPNNVFFVISVIIVYLDSKGKWIDRINIPGSDSTRISLRDDTIKCTDWKTNTIDCYTLTGQEIWQ